MSQTAVAMPTMIAPSKRNPSQAAPTYAHGLGLLRWGFISGSRIRAAQTLAVGNAWGLRPSIHRAVSHSPEDRVGRADFLAFQPLTGRPPRAT